MNKYIAHIIIEARSILVLGSGNSNLDNDAIVAKDFNRLPYIPGTSIAGVLSSIFEKKYGSTDRINVFGGDRTNRNSEDKETFFGSNIEFSDAYLINESGYVLQKTSLKEDLTAYQKKFLLLPKREHARINHKGVAEKHGKFDNEFVYKGARFKFEVSLDDANDTYFNFILSSIYSDMFLIGGGTTNGYGQFDIIDIQTKIYNLTIEDDFNAYLNRTVDLNIDLAGESFKNKIITIDEIWQRKLYIVSSSAIHIGAGYGDCDVDESNYKEWVIEWNSQNKPEWKLCNVIPGSSIKGILAHRVAYYRNIEENKTIEHLIRDNRMVAITSKVNSDLESKMNKVNEILLNEVLDLTEKRIAILNIKNEIEEYGFDGKTRIELFTNIVGENNMDVKHFFGTAGNEDLDGEMGSVIVEDIYINNEDVVETIFDHNAIDRYTGGTIDSALYSEKVFQPNHPFDLNIICRKNIQGTNLSKAINDLLNSKLAIGGKTNKGYGFINIIS